MAHNERWRSNWMGRSNQVIETIKSIGVGTIALFLCLGLIKLILTYHSISVIIILFICGIIIAYIIGEGIRNNDL